MVDLRRHVGEPDGRRSQYRARSAFALDRSPALRGQWGTTVEAFDEPPAIWIAGELRSEPAIGAALAEDALVAA
jgi:hypothetical protein